MVVVVLKVVRRLVSRMVEAVDRDRLSLGLGLILDLGSLS